MSPECDVRKIWNTETRFRSQKADRVFLFAHHLTSMYGCPNLSESQKGDKMMLEDDEFLLLSEANESLLGRVCVRTAYRWRTHGVKTPAGTRVKLRCQRIGGRLFTTRKWVSEFIQSQNVDPISLPDESSRAAAIDKELERMGC